MVVHIKYLGYPVPVVIDDADAHILQEPGWRIHKGISTMYVVRHPRQGCIELLHRRILGLSGRHPFVDHSDRNGLNNSRSNLRTCSHQQNLRNQFRKPENKTSRFKGVYWHRRKCRWHARLCVDKRRIGLGFFRNEVDAATAYNQAAQKRFGEFARLNQV